LNSKADSPNGEKKIRKGKKKGGRDSHSSIDGGSSPDSRMGVS